MKKSLIFVSAVALMFFAGSAWADPIYYIDDNTSLYDGDYVGYVDDFLYFEFVNSGDANELAWVNSKLGTNYDTMYKITADEGMTWLETTGTATDAVYAILFGTENPEYFFIKIGGMPNGQPNHILYSNIESLSWGVIALSVAPGVEIQNIGAVSHIGEMGGGQIPEPTTLLLLGAGLIGIAGLRKRL